MKSDIVAYGRWFLLCVGLACASRSSAHGEPVGGISPFVAADGAIIGGGTTWGLVLAEADGWLRVCEESSGAPPRYFHRTPQGRIVVFGDAGIRITDDGGCTFVDATGDLDGRGIGAFAEARATPNRLFAGTQAVGRTNVLLRSVDHGASFEATGLAVDGARLDAILVSDDGNSVLVHTQDYMSFVGINYISHDGGVLFEADPPALTSYAFVRYLAVGLDGRTFYVAAAREPFGNLLLSSQDGFQTAEQVAAFDDEITDFGEVAGAQFLTLGKTRLFRKRADEEQFSQVDGPRRCLLRLPQDQRLFGCGQLPDGAHFLSTSDGEVWSAHVPYLGVTERRCPAGTAGAEQCVQYWAVDGGSPPADAVPSHDDASADRGTALLCACAGAASPGSPWWSLVWLSLGGWLGFRRVRGPPGEVSLRAVSSAAHTAGDRWLIVRSATSVPSKIPNVQGRPVHHGREKR